MTGQSGSTMEGCSSPGRKQAFSQDDPLEWPPEKGGHSLNPGAR